MLATFFVFTAQVHSLKRMDCPADKQKIILFEIYVFLSSSSCISKSLIGSKITNPV